MGMKLVCSNCVYEIELAENMSLERLQQEAKEFFKKHRTRIGNVYCKKENLYLTK